MRRIRLLLFAAACLLMAGSGSALAAAVRTAAAPTSSSPPTISGNGPAGPDPDRRQGRVERHRADHLHLRVAALRLGRRRLREHQGRDRDDVHAAEAGRRPHAPFRRDGQERRRHDLGDLGRHRGRHRGPATAEPANTSPPTISGTVQEGQTLTADNGRVERRQPIAYSYAWQRCDSGGGHCANIGGANKATYTLSKRGRRPHASVSP